MPRVIQQSSTRGSQHWLQLLISRQPEVINEALRCQLGLSDEAAITWLSPLQEDGFAEYRDNAFLECLGISLGKRSLASF